MTSTQKTFAIAGGIAILAAVALYLFFRPLANGDPPILIGDGSITFHADTVTKKSDYELRVWKFLRKAQRIGIADYPNDPSSWIDLDGNWTLTSVSGSTAFIVSPYTLVTEGEKAICGTPWTGGGTDYTCAPADGSKLTPATLTFTDNTYCPGTTSPTCMLSCPSGKCQIEIEYKIKKNANSKK
jgi:hypothetical protein